jgi:Anti-sigma-K factor rskA
VPHANHTDPEVLALWALGESAGSAAEQEHLAGCADCRVELAQLKDVVGIARDDGPMELEQPPARVWDQIAAAAGVADTVPAPPVHTQPVQTQPGPAQAPQARPTPGRAPRQRGNWRRTRGRVAIAAAAGIIIGAGAAVGIARLASAPAPAAVAVASVQLRSLPQFPQWRDASGSAIMRQASTTQVLDVTLSAPREPGFYEVWLLGRDGVSMISLGDLSSSHTGSFTIPPGTDLKFYSRIDVSLQPFDGSTVHSKTSVVRGSLPAAAIGAN